MTRKPRTPRRRCCECRVWYHPEPSASKTQRTCSEACRALRRTRQAQARRQAEVARYRAAERSRQRKYRARKRAQSGADPPRSRAGLSPQAAQAIEEFLKDLGQREQVSRAGLRQKLRRLLASTEGSAAAALPQPET